MTELEPRPDDRSSVAQAFHKASEVTTIAFMMVFPTLPGYWLDRLLGTIPLFTMLGFAFGMTAGIWQLMKMANRPDATGLDETQGAAKSDEQHERNEPG